MMHALHLQALESIEKAQELAEGLGNKVGSYSFSSALSVGFNTKPSLEISRLVLADKCVCANKSMLGT